MAIYFKLPLHPCLLIPRLSFQVLVLMLMALVLPLLADLLRAVPDALVENLGIVFPISNNTEVRVPH